MYIQTVMMLLPIGAGAQYANLPESPYDLWVQGNAVTDDNKANILGGDMATVSYDSEANVLTLNDVTIEGATYTSGCILSGRSSLTIAIMGENMIASSDTCTAIIAIGTGEQTLTLAKGGDGCSLSFNVDRSIRGFNSVSYTDLYWNGHYKYEPDSEEGAYKLMYHSGIEAKRVLDEQTQEVAFMPTLSDADSYNLWVGDAQVTSANADNVMGQGGEGTLSFDVETNTLTLNNATIAPEDERPGIVYGGTADLTIMLVGTNRIQGGRGCEAIRCDVANVPAHPKLIFTTDEDEPGLLINTGEEGDMFDSDAIVEYQNGLALSNSAEGWMISCFQSYDLMVGSTTVTSVNCTDVLGDGTVKYVDDDKTLVLDNANLDVPINSSLTGGLTIYLLGDNTIESTDNLITTSAENATIVFTTSETTPGKLTLVKTSDEGAWFSGFVGTTVPSDYATIMDGNTMTIARSVPITPIVAETGNGEKPETVISTEDFGSMTSGEEQDTYLSIVINNVLYTLRPSDYNEGDGENPNDPSGVNLTVIPADMDSVLTMTPGSDAYTEAFRGITIEIPEGNGEVTVSGEIGTNAQLGVRIGDSDPVVFPNEQYPATNELETLCIPYSCSKPTFVYIYLEGCSSSSRYDGPIRGRVIAGHIKITSVGASSSLVVSENSYNSASNSILNRVIAYDLPAGATTADNHGIVLTTVPVGIPAAISRGVRREAEQSMVITELGTSIFDSVDKDQILYIDLSGTKINDMTVNRSAGLFEGFGQNTLFHLPDGNDDGGEDNVVINGNCARLSLTDALNFRAHKGFTAQKAILDRTFQASKASTLFLPFALSKAQADALGDFHTFKEIQGANAVFNEAESNGTEANTPYIFLPSADTAIDVDNVTVVGKDDFLARSGNMVGTYERLAWADEQTEVYVFAATDLADITAGQFVRAGAGAWLPSFQTYIEVSSAPASLNVVVADVTTGIHSPSTLQESPSSLHSMWYNVNGQRLSGVPSAKGLYINDKKKVWVNDR